MAIANSAPTPTNLAMTAEYTTKMVFVGNENACQNPRIQLRFKKAPSLNSTEVKVGVNKSEGKFLVSTDVEKLADGERTVTSPAFIKTSESTG